MTRATPHSTAHDDPTDRRIRRTWRLLLGALGALGALVAWRLITNQGHPVDVAAAAFVIAAAYAAIVHRNALAALETSRRAEVESFTRILRGLSRSISPDAIVDAIVEDLGQGAGADHIVVVRRRAEANALEATLVSARPGVRSSTTLLPLGDLEDPDAAAAGTARPSVAVPIAAAEFVTAAPAGLPVAVRAGSGAQTGHGSSPEPQWWPGRPGRLRGALRSGRDAVVALVHPRSSSEPRRDRGSRFGLPHGLAHATADAVPERIAERVAARVRAVYGLKHTLVAPLHTDGAMIGAIVLSRRTGGAWPDSARRMLAAAADEASAALARAASHRDAETRASTDALTGLPNRRYFDEFCGLLARRRRAGDAVGVLMIDIDRFKVLNDTYGHATGDEVLRAVGGAIAGAVRGDDVPARYGGEEFAVLLRNPTPEMAVEIGERVREAVAALDLGRYRVPGVTVSVGVAVGGRPDRPVDELIADADRALYEAKRKGRDRVVANLGLMASPRSAAELGGGLRPRG